MLNPKQFRDHVIDPTLRAIGLYSEAASNLMLGTAIVESDLTTLVQLKGGPGLGVYQIKPTTLNDIFYRYLLKPNSEQLKIDVVSLTTGQDIRDQLITNLAFATAIARIRYWMVPDPLPAATNIHALGMYWKKHYNTQLGGGVPDVFVQKYQRYVIGEAAHG